MDRFRQSLVGIEDAIAEIRTAVDLLERSVQRTRELLDANVEVSDLARRPGTMSREATIEALNSMHAALRQSRAAWYAYLIDTEGMTLSDVARLTGRPRQIIKRQYDGLHEKPAELPPSRT